MTISNDLPPQDKNSMRQSELSLLTENCYHRDKVNPFGKFGWTHPEVVIF